MIPELRQLLEITKEETAAKFLAEIVMALGLSRVAARLAVPARKNQIRKCQEERERLRRYARSVIRLAQSISQTPSEILHEQNFSALRDHISEDLRRITAELSKSFDEERSWSYREGFATRAFLLYRPTSVFGWFWHILYFSMTVATCVFVYGLLTEDGRLDLTWQNTAIALGLVLILVTLNIVARKFHALEAPDRVPIQPHEVKEFMLFRPRAPFATTSDLVRLILALDGEHTPILSEG